MAEKAGSPKTVADQSSAIEEIMQLARKLTGVQLSERHREMVKSRVGSRAAELGISSLNDYLQYFHENRKTEETRFVGLITTHHTYFFREYAHFEFLQNTVLPALLPELRARSDKKLRILSAACSRGQEVYSLAMFLDHHLKQLDPSLSYEIVGNDIDAESVAVAKNGVYSRDELKEVPLSLMADHWVRGTGDIANYVKARESLRKNLRFATDNLLDSSTTNVFGRFDVIFCRNVFIYFNADQIRAITEKLLSRMNPSGFLFIGVSESLSQLKLPVHAVGPSIYQNKTAKVLQPTQAPAGATAAAPAVAAKGTPAPGASPAPAAIPAVLKVLCVDDSPVILNLLKSMLTKDKGFEVVGTAANGEEAAKKASELKPDLFTLDIHMPVQTGIEYLEKNYRTGHPPVVMVTSVTRENSDLAGKALALGAADYVEKPALSNLQERADEIRTKLKCAYLAHREGSRPLALDKSFQKSTAKVEADACLRVVALNLSSRPKLKSLFAEAGVGGPPFVLLVDGAKDTLTAIAALIGKQFGVKVSAPDELPQTLRAGEIYLFDLATQTEKIAKSFGSARKVSVMVLGEITTASANRLMNFQGAQLLLEDTGGKKGAAALRELASDIVPVTSFSYLSLEFFAGAPATAERKAS
jgi:chemotaxis protein methyltransferase CheR